MTTLQQSPENEMPFVYVTLATHVMAGHFPCFFTFGPRGRRARSARRPRGQNVAAIALDMGQTHLWYENNTMQTLHAIQTLRTVCGFLDMGDGCCLIFDKNQLMFIVRKSITAQIKKKVILFFS